MDKKFYVTPEMEVADIEMVNYLITYSSGIDFTGDDAEDEDEEP